MLCTTQYEHWYGRLYWVGLMNDWIDDEIQLTAEPDYSIDSNII